MILDFDKNFRTICPRRIYQPFSSELSTVKCNFIIIIRQVLRQKKICYTYICYTLLYFQYTFFYKQSIFDPPPKNCLSFSKKLPQKIV